MRRPRVAVVQFPGVNCERESARALERSGLEAEVFGWTRAASELHDFDAYLIPGGFSYQDRVRGGALAAKDPLLEALAAAAERGKPVLGICNGAQVLVEAGLVPGGEHVELALAGNRMPDRSGYFARWIYVRIEASACVFTRHLPVGTLLPLPIAHGEGRFTSRDPDRLAALGAAGQVPLRYVRADGTPAAGFPANPNGAEFDAAAVCNARGNVLAIMPHPERALNAGGLGRAVAGEWAAHRDRARASGEADAAGPGLSLFEGLQRHLVAERT
ncbi:MAG: phosphoribosylformylglycinamidine synthase I [Candidatus Eisenbacteria bacterium]|uniref:Phosphoribosylformylglycinamidine synthase subunit PurQ n=1 Tax=Eiseniibacteriota bacterium TaxID=2212470 RepID=A0A849SN58_UNCEI|nr:phosphoribosylformylglycinamidine synthase I [Candidatus Eisenbacteria bacterium]